RLRIGSAPISNTIGVVVVTDFAASIRHRNPRTHNHRRSRKRISRSLFQVRRKQHEELTSLHYSITSSARVISDGGKSIVPCSERIHCRPDRLPTRTPAAGRRRGAGQHGFLHVGSAEAFPWVVTAFRQGLKVTGFIEGQNVTIEFRWAEGKYDRLPALASELVRRDVAVIFAAGGSAPALVAKAATAQIPIVFSSGGDPVTRGLVASLNRPGGTVTGVSLMFSDTVAKRLGLLHEVVPKASLIGVVVNPDYADVELQLKQLQEG